jgi:CDP-glucose 4,6-dehydratase
MTKYAVVDTAFWQNKRVYLTGHTGFKGSWLSLWLQSLGVKVKGYALEPPTCPSLFNVARVHEGMASEIGDIRDIHQLTKSMVAFDPDIVIHFAAQPLVRYSYHAPVETYSTNVMGTVHVLEAVRQCKNVRAIVNITTDKCYENKEWLWGYRENEPMGGFDPYSSSKGCAELVTSAYRRSFLKDAGIGLASARAGNVIGGGDWAQDRLIPDILKAFENGEQVLIRNPHSIRPWQHVLEPLSGYLILAQSLYTQPDSYAEGWNFGSNDEDAKPVEFIVKRLAEIWGDNATWALDNNINPHEANYLKLDCSKAKARLNWKSKWPLDEALNRIVEWQKYYQQGVDMQSVTFAQIANYQIN